MFLKKNNCEQIGMDVCRKASRLSWELARSEQPSAMGMLDCLSELFASETGTQVVSWDDDDDKVLVFPKSIKINGGLTERDGYSVRTAVEDEDYAYGWRSDLDGKSEKGLYYRRYGNSTGAKFSVAVHFYDDRYNDVERQKLAELASEVFGNVTYIFNARGAETRSNPLKIPSLSYYINTEDDDVKKHVNRLKRYSGAAYIRPAGFDKLTSESYVPLMKIYRRWMRMFGNPKHFGLALDLGCFVVLLKDSDRSKHLFDIEIDKLQGSPLLDERPVCFTTFPVDGVIGEKELASLRKKMSSDRADVAGNEVKSLRKAIEKQIKKDVPTVEPIDKIPENEAPATSYVPAMPGEAGWGEDSDEMQSAEAENNGTDSSENRENTSSKDDNGEDTVSQNSDNSGGDDGYGF